MEVIISNHPVSADIKRKIIVPGYNKDFLNEVYTVHYKLKHYDLNDNSIKGFPDYQFVLIASNTKYVWVDNQNNVFYQETPNTQQIGMYDFFQTLLHNLTDTQIITAQIMRLDLEQYFDNYVSSFEDEGAQNNFG